MQLHRAVVAGLALALALMGGFAEARGGSSGHRSGASHSSTSRSKGGSSHTGPSPYRSPAYHVSKTYTSRPAYGTRSHASFGVNRDVHGRIARSSHAKSSFKHAHPCPSTGRSYGACPGYVIDHIHALKHGGADDPNNMQWQTVQAAKEKDTWE